MPDDGTGVRIMEQQPQSEVVPTTTPDYEEPQSRAVDTAATLPAADMTVTFVPPGRTTLAPLAATTLSDVDLVRAITTEHRHCGALVRGSLAHGIRAGILLQEAKDRYGDYGDWLPWLAANVPEISVRSAQGYMRLASKYATVAHLEPDGLRDALCLLARPVEHHRLAPSQLRWPGEPDVVGDDIPIDHRCPFCQFGWSGKPMQPKRDRSERKKNPKCCGRLAIVPEVRYRFGLPKPSSTCAEPVRAGDDA
jgi:hypothetical protein